ncbi:MAG: XdhC family protein, partial [Halieaceae bacterium]|nr:XdhC family protein [Halieaceae bacterium]
MHSVDQQVLEHLVGWLEQGQAAWLCTIVATIGSSPRPVGSLFACNAAGDTTGSLSGGCVEDDLVERLCQGALEGTQVLEYGVTAEENERLGLPCGGRLEILLEPLVAGHLPQLKELLDAVTERRYITRRVSLADGAVALAQAEGFAALQKTADSVTL